MNETPFISVIVPVYNGADYLAFALESLTFQTYQHFEVVVVDDGSTDGGASRNVALNWAHRFPTQIRVLTQPNLGVAGALNAGIRAARGAQFCWLSHDDVFLPDKLERQVQLLDQLGRRDVVLFSDWSYMGPQGEPLHDIRLPPELFEKPSMYPALGGALNGCTMMAPMQLMRSVGGFDLQYRFVQDYRLWYKLLRLAPFIHMPSVTVRQRLHPGQDSHKPAAIDEGEALWRDMVLGLTHDEQIAMSGSAFRYFYTMSRRLADMPYPKARQSVEEQRDRVVPETRVTVVLAAEQPTAMALQSITSVRNQLHANWEIVIASSDPSSWAPVIGADPRVKVVPADPDLAAAALQGSGQYAAFMDEGDVFTPDKIQRQLDDILNLGMLWAHSSWVDSTGALRDPVRYGDDQDRQVLVRGGLERSSLLVHNSLLKGADWSSDEAYSATLIRWARLNKLHHVAAPLSVKRAAGA